jgi:hypothetical protein
LHRRVRQHPPLDPLVDSPLGRRVHQRRRTVSKTLGAAPQRAREAELLRREPVSAIRRQSGNKQIRLPSRNTEVLAGQPVVTALLVCTERLFLGGQLSSLSWASYLS